MGDGDRLALLEAEVEAQRRRLEDQENRIRRLRGPEPDRAEGLSRRSLLRGAGVAAAGAVAGVVAGGAPAGATVVTAGAADGDAIQIGGLNANSAGSANTTRLHGSTNGVSMFSVQNTAISGVGVPNAIVGSVSGIAAVGVRGNAEATGGNTGGIGVYGSTDQTNGVGVLAQSFSGAALRLHDASQTIPPPAGNWTAGSLVVTANHLFYCYATGSGTASQWMRLSSPLVTLAAPFRVYDSRASQPNPSGSTQGTLNFGGGARPINCQPAVPAGVPATTFLFNVTLANTVGAVGSVLVWANGASEPNAASVTWTGSGVVVANAVTSGCDASQVVQIKCTTGSSTNVILDVIGYYL